MADYLGHRCKNGPTAARGAHAASWRLSKVLKIDLGLQCDVNLGWGKAVKGHQVTPQISYGVAEFHFDHLSKHSVNPYVLTACASHLIGTYGLVRPTHIQRSRLVTDVKDSAVFWCSVGKTNGGAPFHLVRPKETATGTQAADKMLGVLRLRHQKDSHPWLPRQGNPITTNPSTGTSFRKTSLFNKQAQHAR